MHKNSSECLGNHIALNNFFERLKTIITTKFENYFHSMKIGKSTTQLHDNQNTAEEHSHWHYFQNVLFYQLTNDKTLTANQNQQR